MQLKKFSKTVFWYFICKEEVRNIMKKDGLEFVSIDIYRTANEIYFYFFVRALLAIFRFMYPRKNQPSCMKKSIYEKMNNQKSVVAVCIKFWKLNCFFDRSLCKPGDNKTLHFVHVFAVNFFSFFFFFMFLLLVQRKIVNIYCRVILKDHINECRFNFEHN